MSHTVKPVEVRALTPGRGAWIKHRQVAKITSTIFHDSPRFSTILSGVGHLVAFSRAVIRNGLYVTEGINRHEMLTGSMPSGIYFVKVKLPGAAGTMTKKVIVAN